MSLIGAILVLTLVIGVFINDTVHVYGEFTKTERVNDGDIVIKGEILIGSNTSEDFHNTVSTIIIASDVISTSSIIYSS